jgi:hypothetical protein
MRLIELISLIFILQLTLFNFGANLIAQSNKTHKIKMKGEASVYLNEMEILNKDKKPLSEDAIIKQESDGSIRVSLGLSDPIAKLIILHPRSIKKCQFRIEQQYETSVTIMNEGPHMDLVNWKHHVSDWEILEEINENIFLSKDVSSNEFPDVTTDEIVEATKQQITVWAKDGYGSNQKWIELAKKCKNSFEYPCGVGVSKVRLKISVKDGDSWKEINIINLIVPMGC